MFPDSAVTRTRAKFKATESGPETESMRAIMIQFTFGIINKPSPSHIQRRISVAWPSEVTAQKPTNINAKWRPDKNTLEVSPQLVSLL